MKPAAHLTLAHSAPAVIEMRNNVARDIISSASDFLGGVGLACFEYVANGYEAYNVGQLPRVDVTVKLGRNGSVEIRDHGIGMDARTLGNFWTMHGTTERRSGGLNNRGYHGTGKIAAFAFADELRVETVRGGLLNVHVLTMESIRAAAESCDSPRIDVIASDEPTDRPDGTAVLVSRPHKAITQNDVRLIADKVQFELMQWMVGAAVTVNSAPVVAEALACDSEETFTEGPFTATVGYRDAGFPENIAKVFYSVGGVFIARDDAGKEGHRLSSRFSVRVDTTAEWAEEHFAGRRERFVSESRDLRLKRQNAAAGQLGEFAERIVRAEVARIEEQERLARKNLMTDALKLLEDSLAKALSADWRSISTRPGKRTRKPSEGTVETRERRDPEAEREPRKPKPKVAITFVEFAEPNPHYRVDHESVSVEINLRHPTVRSLSQFSTGASSILLHQIALAGYAELAARNEMDAMLEDDADYQRLETDTDWSQRLMEIRKRHESRLLEAFGSMIVAAARGA